MEYGSSKGHESSNEVMKPAHNSRSTASNENEIEETEWNARSALPQFVYSPLGPNSSMKARARFIESVVFAFVVCCVVVSAAVPGILY